MHDKRNTSGSDSASRKENWPRSNARSSRCVGHLGEAIREVKVSILTLQIMLVIQTENCTLQRLKIGFSAYMLPKHADPKPANDKEILPAPTSSAFPEHWQFRMLKVENMRLPWVLAIG